VRAFTISVVRSVREVALVDVLTAKDDMALPQLCVMYKSLGYAALFLLQSRTNDDRRPALHCKRNAPT